MRQLKASLSQYLRRVEAGETLVVTDRGRPVARIVPEGVPQHIAKLMAEGRLTWSGEAFVPPPHRVKLKPGPPLSDYIAEDRR